jgi:GDP-L-fucose synthase
MTIDELRSGKILVLGGTGFLGRSLVAHLKELGCNVKSVGNYHGPWRQDGYDANGVDLTNPFALPAFWDCYGPFDYVFNAAGGGGNIQGNIEDPTGVFYNSTIIGLNVVKTCLARGVKKLLSAVASCGYPVSDTCLAEDDYLFGKPHPTVANHGYAKRNVFLMSRFAAKHGLKAVCVCPPTVYGVGFNTGKAKVLDALVMKFVDAKKRGETKVTLWGSGKPLREVLYVEDAARLLVEAMLKYDDVNLPLNLASGQEYSVRELARLVADEVGYAGDVVWDTTKPDGAYRKRLSDWRMHEVLGPQQLTSIREGIRKTASWWATK